VERKESGLIFAVPFFKAVEGVLWQIQIDFLLAGEVSETGFRISIYHTENHTKPTIGSHCF